MSEREMDANGLEAAIDAAMSTEIVIPGEEPGHNVRLGDYLSFSAADAVELGVKLTQVDENGRSRFHWYSDIHRDELNDAERVILNSVIRAAVTAYLAARTPSPIKEE